MSHVKDFDAWHPIKKEINNSKSPLYKEGEVWWCSLGINVGHEEDGKKERFSRPVLIVKKFNNYIFWALPLTTKIKDIVYYHKVHFKGKEQCVMLAQLRLLDSKRLTDKMG